MTRIKSYIQALWITVFLMALDCPAANTVPPLSELLDKFTQALDSTQSMISSYESSTISSGYLPPLNIRHANKRKYERGHRRTDGKGRIYQQVHYWGHDTLKKRVVSQDEGSYSLRVAAPDFQYLHNKNTLGRPDGLVIYNNHQTVGYDNFRDEIDAFFLGYLGVDSRIDVNLKNARQISVRPRPESVNGSPCYVVQADTPYGDYKIWLDSAHGFQPARIEASRRDDDIINITKHQPPPDKRVEARDTLRIDSIKFEKVQGVWVPVAGRVRKHIEWPHHGFFIKGDTRFKITKIELNPDHDALDSFADPMKNPQLDPELLDGTNVRLGDEQVRCEWRDGKLLDGGGSVIDLKQLRKQIARSLLNESLPDLSNLCPALSGVRADNKPILLCLIDLQQRPSRQCLKDLAGKSELLRTHDVETILIQTSQIDIRQYDTFLRSNHIHDTIEIVEGDFDTQKPHWGVKAMPWLILTDSRHKVLNEGFAANELEDLLEKTRNRIE